MRGNEVIIFTKKGAAMSSSTSDDDNISHSPSRLLFDEDDSSSDHSGIGPRRRCSFVSNSSRPNVMDLRYPESVDGKSYDLSVCSDDNSFSTLQTDDALEKMGMFEIALSAGFKAKDDEGVLFRANSNPDRSKPAKETLLHKVRMKRHSLDHGGLLRHSPVLPPIGADDDSSVVKKSKASRKKAAYIRRCAQAAAMFLFLSTLVASLIFFEKSDMDPSSLIASFPAEISSMIENLFGSSSSQEVVEDDRGEERIMAQQFQTMMKQEGPPVENHEYDKFFVQAFRNNQKISKRLNKDPMRQRMMVQRDNKVDQSMDAVAQVRVQEFRENQRLAHEHVARRRLNESNEQAAEDNKTVKRRLMKSRNSASESLDLTLKWFLQQVQYQPRRDFYEAGSGGLRKK